MAKEIYFNNTKIDKVLYNGKELEKVYYNNVLVFEKEDKYTIIYSADGVNQTEEKIEANINTLKNYILNLNKSKTNINIKIAYNKTSTISMTELFSGKSNFKTIDLSGLNASNIEIGKATFRQCYGLTTLNFKGCKLVGAYDTSQAFSECSKLTSIDLSSFDASGVRNMYSMFSGCSQLTSLDLSKCDARNVTEIDYMFYYCSNLKTLDLSGLSTSKANDTTQMFNSCTKLETLIFPNLSCSIRLNSCTNLTATSIDNILKNISTVSNKTLTLGSANLAKASEEAKSIATSRGWTLN